MVGELPGVDRDISEPRLGVSIVAPTLSEPLHLEEGIVLVGAILVAGLQFAPLGPVVGFILIVLASLNVFGGYTMTERMLAMFRPRPVVVKKDD